jgi:transcriptional regulator with XRE-family HTH domain
MGFGARLREKRKQKGLTQEQLGQGLGTNGENCSKSVVYGWEKEQHYPRVDQLYLICEKLGCSADAIMFGRETAGAFSPEVAELASRIDLLNPETRVRVITMVEQALSLAVPSTETGNATRHRTM